MKKEFKIGSRMIGRDAPCFCVAEMSGNHLKDYGRAVEIIHAAKEAGADAVKLQTYTADSLSVNCDNEYFQIHGGLWDGMTEYKLYEEASTPWEWQPKLKEVAESLGKTQESARLLMRRPLTLCGTAICRHIRSHLMRSMIFR